MCTQEEMRRCPAGASDKHAQWEKRNKSDILAWKNIRLRMGASGVDFEGMGTQGANIANLELYRPSGGAGELNMDDQIVKSQDYHNLMQVTGETVAFDADDFVLIKQHFPKVFPKLAFLDNDQRSVLKAQLLDLDGAPAPESAEDTPDEIPTNQYSLKGQPFGTLRKNIKAATGIWPKNGDECKSLIKEHNLK
ncbi:hypothetical protein KAR91_41000, partial [Candidatus Pacearchaeota archaeon]|nr:hypothetical protein [Candidatus Pacearchaeota archaeon]